jgi:hypothetical protein
LTDMVDGLVSPKMMVLWKRLLEEFAIHAPMREQRVKEIVAK